jgi:hypothetical protein
VSVARIDPFLALLGSKYEEITKNFSELLEFGYLTLDESSIV